MFVIPWQALGLWTRTTSNSMSGGSMVGPIAACQQLIEEMPDIVSPNAVSATQDAEIAAALGGRSVVLVGMMGAGKSTIGRRLSVRLALPFLDADAEIEAAAGMSIPDIFESRGEADFRDGEVRVIARLLDSGPAVIATGGGAVMRQETRDRIRDKAVSIWLKVDTDVIMRRVKRRADRPLLQTADPEATVERLIREREPVYQPSRRDGLVARRSARKDRR